ncbi:helix-turn-helix transcriptional regulator, partial [Streptococcus pyogenes]|uniref:helix-turn-helix transcriptional regulator n=1 Tax=Streptococcus pyogenes TaxID=1314 RepID=UPI003DA15340
PFARTPVLRNEKLAALALHAATSPHDELLVHELLTDVMGALSAPGGSLEVDVAHPRNRRVEAAEQLLRAHVTRPIKLKHLEQATGLSAPEVCRQFKRQYGTSPYRYLLMRRVELAADMIRTGHRLADVAAAVGFADQSHMNRAFRCFVGLSPGAYAALHAQSRSNARENTNSIAREQEES